MIAGWAGCAGQAIRLHVKQFHMDRVIPVAQILRTCGNLKWVAAATEKPFLGCDSVLGWLAGWLLACLCWACLLGLVGLVGLLVLLVWLAGSTQSRMLDAQGRFADSSAILW